MIYYNVLFNFVQLDHQVSYHWNGELPRVGDCVRCFYQEGYVVIEGTIIKKIILISPSDKADSLDVIHYDVVMENWEPNLKDLQDILNEQ